MSNDLINSIAQIAFKNLPVEDWKKFIIKVCALRKMVEINAVYYDLNNTEISFNAKNKTANTRDEDLTFLFMDLRKAMFDLSPDKGAWFSAEIEVDESGKFKTSFEYDKKPEFTYTPVDEKFIDDYKNFYREKSLVPYWMKEILEKNKVSIN